MNYEYKAKMMLGAIQDAKDDYINATSEEDKEEYRFEIRQLENLKVLYEDAAKVDEYEVKAKAYDRVTEKLYARINHIIMTSHPAQCKPGYVDGLYNALYIISSELESGESDAKK